SRSSSSSSSPSTPSSSSASPSGPEQDFSDLAAFHTLGNEQVPPVVLERAGDDAAELVWRNELGGLTFRIGERYAKWNPRRTGIDLEHERRRLDWLVGRHPAPRVLEYGGAEQAEGMLPEAVPDVHGVGDCLGG